MGKQGDHRQMQLQNHTEIIPPQKSRQDLKKSNSLINFYLGVSIPFSKGNVL